MAITVRDTSASASERRAALVDRLRDEKVIRTPSVEAAFRSVPRHLFLPGVPLEVAYADEPVYTKRDDSSGVSLSAASQPRIVAMMLEQLQLQPGDHVLEVGAGTGYNAALLAAITGDAGHVTAIDIDQDLVDGARQHLAAAGITNVEVILGDGALGHAIGAPYDRVIATVGAFETPPAWLEQLAPHGRLLVPLRLAGAESRSIVFERVGDGWHSRGSEMNVFMPLRGIADDARRVIDISPAGDRLVTVEAHQDNDHATDPATLAGVLDSPREHAWTGVHFSPGESFEWLHLWLACRLPNPIMRMNVEPAAKEADLVSPVFPIATMATTTADGSLAYLTIRPAEPGEDGRKRYEIGVIAHGPTAPELAEHVGEDVSTWDTRFRDRHVHFAIPDTLPAADPNAGRFVLDRPHHPLTVTWE